MNILPSLFLFLKLVGIQAASGIYYQQDQLYIVSDNSPYLYQYDMQASQLHKIQLDSTQQQEMVSKKEKADFEALYAINDTLVVVGSGSTSERETAFIYHQKDQSVQRVSLAPLFRQMRKIGKVDEENFNIEGIAYANGTWYFLNRGNGPKHQNVVFTFNGNAQLQFQATSLQAKHLKLPSIHGQPSGFSDALLLDNRLFFIATAESKASNYEDGDNMGSYIAYINLKNWKISPIQSLSKTKKLEGLSIYQQSDSTKTFLLCEDPDDETNTNCPVYRYDFIINSRE
ncbi:hypothetical protein GCM10023231_18600 [Olivibacter ginsenosidimutans]|uniref:Uncharacterized protein n=1 Tax=Olivibacter ginsenosidimutans TaxID=1176537 RepID=A0ABP9B947_9SPHI